MQAVPPIEWHFPLPRTHTGALLGNGTVGVMVWGEANVLRITLGRAGWWDHRGGKQWTAAMNFERIRRLLEAGDEAGIRAIFAERDVPGLPHRPTGLPLGRVELVFDAGADLRRAELDTETATLTVYLDHAGRTHAIAIALLMSEPLVNVHLPGELAAPQVQDVPAWQYVGERLAAVGFEPPAPFTADSTAGWTQATPGDDAACVAHTRAGQDLWIAIDLAGDALAARAAATQRLARALGRSRDEMLDAAHRWWRQYWKDVPRIDLPEEKLAFLYRYGMYKFAGLTHPDGVAATLQGPWVEEYQLPPWSNDYHFNINVQMCYSPAYAGNRLAHLRPLFDLIWSWRDSLRENARLFVGIDDGYLLPHAVDDRCRIIGAFWTGTVDHACTAWVGKMMFDYCLYGGDPDGTFLRDVVYPFLGGAMRVYDAMLERQADGTIALPVSVSPEYRGAAMNAWGRNASFQLAAIHWLAGALDSSAAMLGEAPDPRWAEIRRDLPRACLGGAPGHERIHLWEGTDLEESHRHHSHLAGITPFDIIDIDDPAWRPFVERTLAHWIYRGMGLWSGWCMPWASQLHARVGNADMAVTVLELWQRVFTNEGHGTLHDCSFPGLTLLGAGATVSRNTRGEIMQMDAGMGATAAILDLLIHARQGVLHLFPGCPARWARCAFEGIRCEGGFLVSASRSRGSVTEVRVRSELGRPLRLANPWSAAQLHRPGHPPQHLHGQVLEMPTTAGETLTLVSAPSPAATDVAAELR